MSGCKIKIRFTQRRRARQGAAALLMLVLMIPMLFLLAFAVDYGFLIYLRADLQRTADQAALAGAMELLPDDYGQQDLAAVRGRVREYVEDNLGAGFEVRDADIEIGRYLPASAYTNFQIVDNGVLDTVRVTLRRSDLANRSISLFFARLFNHEDAGATVVATAALQKARYLGPGTGILPFSIDLESWNQLNSGDIAIIYGNGQITDEVGNSIPGNWGTLDIGSTSNSTNDLSRQIEHGLSQGDLNALYEQGTISTTEYLDATLEISLNGDTGFSSGVKHAVQAVEGQVRLAPIFDQVNGGGGNLQFEVVGWGAVRIIDSQWKGSQKSSLSVQKTYVYDQKLYPANDLTDERLIIEAAYTAPVLTQ